MVVGSVGQAVGGIEEVRETLDREFAGRAARRDLVVAELLRQEFFLRCRGKLVEESVGVRLTRGGDPELEPLCPGVRYSGDPQHVDQSRTLERRVVTQVIGDRFLGPPLGPGLPESPTGAAARTVGVSRGTAV